MSDFLGCENKISEQIEREVTLHCTAWREQNGNKIYYTNLTKVWK